MKNLVGTKIGEYEVVETMGSDDGYDYEEITLGELLDRQGLSKDKKIEFANSCFAINIHMLTAAETFDWIMELFDDVGKDERLKGLNAIVLLSLKKKGRGTKYNKLSDERFRELVDKAFEKGISFGFDSCTCCKFVKTIKGRSDFKKLETMSESCESGLYSSYVDVRGDFYPCSFMGGEANWEQGISVANCEDFMKDVWFNERVVKWRKGLIDNKDENGCRVCPNYEV